MEYNMFWLQVALVLLGGGYDNNRLSSSATGYLYIKCVLYKLLEIHILYFFSTGQMDCEYIHSTYVTAVLFIFKGFAMTNSFSVQ
jgi:hypothetical protein